MAFPRDRVLLLAIGATLFFAAKIIAADLHRIKKLVEITNEEPLDESAEDKTEDALKLESLNKLLDSPNCDLRSASLLIIAERAAKGPTRHLLLKDLSHKDRQRRDKALNALHFLVCHRSLTRTNAAAFFKDQEALHALIECLCSFLPEHDPSCLQYEARKVPKTRPPGETKALQVMNAVLTNNVSAAINAGIISRWLAHYPFPKLGSDERHGIDNLIQYCYNYDTDMATILGALGTHIDGSRQLRKHGLLAVSKIIEDRSALQNDTGVDDTEDDDDDDDDDSDDSQDYYYGSPRADAFRFRDSTSMSDLPWTNERRRRNRRSITAEEIAARRRRRQAIIINAPNEDVEVIMPNAIGSPSVLDSDPEDEELVRELNRQLRESVLS